VEVGSMRVQKKSSLSRSYDTFSEWIKNDVND
jgi:hypothetical protein